MKEVLDEIWQCIRYHKNGYNDENLCVMIVAHIIAGILGAALIAAFTPIGCWIWLTGILAIVLGAIWQLCPDGDLAVGYFVAFHISTCAWVGMIPIALIIGILTFPIIIHEYKKTHEDQEKEPEAMIFQVDDDTTATKPKKRKKK